MFIQRALDKVAKVLGDLALVDRDEDSLREEVNGDQEDQVETTSHGPHKGAPSVLTAAEEPSPGVTSFRRSESEPHSHGAKSPDLQLSWIHH